MNNDTETDVVEEWRSRPSELVSHYPSDFTVRWNGFASHYGFVRFVVNQPDTGSPVDRWISTDYNCPNEAMDHLDIAPVDWHRGRFPFISVRISDGYDGFVTVARIESHDV